MSSPNINKTTLVSTTTKGKGDDVSAAWPSTFLLGAAVVVALAAVGVTFAIRARGSTTVRSNDPYANEKALVKLSKHYHESRDHKCLVEFLPQSTIQLTSKELHRLGLSPSATWHDFERDVAKLEEEEESIKVVHLIRHGEGDHNAAEREFGSEKWENEIAKSPRFRDAHLNSVGQQQCEKLRESFTAALDNGFRADVIIVSPLTRAIETAKIGLAEIWGKVPIYAVELTRERFGKNTCDQRRSISELKNEFPEINFDLFMESEHDEWWTDERETDEHIETRIAYFYNWLMQTPWKRVVIAGHSSQMAHTTKVLKAPYHWPANCEMVPLVIHKKQD
mmetsp:Transcript_16404/g.29183  ORF Transcript_16404/g.29183 Transcript_16404/m.29183 type:complete len:336 (-) Transcript_16404:386-1393(-)